MHKLPALSQLLLQGGDERIALVGDSGVNKYGVAPGLARGRVEFSSSTASHPSAQAWVAMARFRRRINTALQQHDPHTLWQQEVQRMQASFLQIWQLDGARVRWHPQRCGSSAHALGASLARRRFGRPCQVIMGAAAETGAKVLQSLRQGSGAEVIEIAVRHADGSCRGEHDIDRDFCRAALAALVQGMPVLVVRTDESKSGGIYPSAGLLAMLVQRFGDQLAVLVDCAQLRCDAAQLRQYLEQGFMVAVSGSKYFAAPAFCGALLSGDSWPTPMPAEQLDTDQRGFANFALLTRWEAALGNMAQHQALACSQRQQLTALFAAAVSQAVVSSPCLSVLAANRDGRDGPRSLFALRLGRAGHPSNLTAAEVTRVYHGMLARPRDNGIIYALGQPVPCGGRDYQPSQYLRISLSAAMLVALGRMAGQGAAAWLAREVPAALHAIDEEIRQLP